MIKLIMTLFITFFSLSSQLVFSYEKNIIQYDLKQFNRYIRPQLYNITNDYEDFLEYVRPKYKNHFSLRTKIIRLYSEIYLLKKKCVLFTENCVQRLNDFNQNFNQFYEAALKVENDFQANIISFYENAEAQRERIKLISFVHKLHTKINLFTNFVTLYPSKKHKLDGIKNDLLDLYQKFHLYIFELLPESVQQDLKYGHTFFFKTIDVLILAENRFHLLKERINDLNNSWHELNVQLYKRNKTVNKRAKSQLNTINNRWISILKMIINSNDK